MSKRLTFEIQRYAVGMCEENRGGELRRNLLRQLTSLVEDFQDRRAEKSQLSGAVFGGHESLADLYLPDLENVEPI